jgi:hypothetical protein
MFSDSDYSYKLTAISDKELIREQDENYFELLFLYTMYNSVKKEPFWRAKTISEFEISFSDLRRKISAVKSEIKNRNSVIEKLSSPRRKAIALKVNREIR